MASMTGAILIASGRVPMNSAIFFMGGV